VGCKVASPHLHVVRRDNLNRAWAKSRTSRIVPVGTWVLAFYDRYVGDRLACPQADHSDFVFVNLFHAPLGSPMTDSAVRQLIAGLGRRAGLGRAVTPHMLRHSTAEEMVEAGVGIDVVQELLGHRSIVTTQMYAHASPRRLREAVDAVEAATKQRRNQRRKGARL
jgi:integrase/recombinase XerD